MKQKDKSFINILYAEDDKDIRKILLNGLNKFFTCTSAKDGEEAYKIYKDNPGKFHLIITDINMPVLSGLDFCKKVREYNKRIPIIITTAFNDNSFLHESISLGINRYMVKPLNLINIIETINELIEPILLRNENEKREKNCQKKLLEQAKFVAVGELAAGITHEINTPLTFMKSSFELIEMDVEELEDSSTKKSILESLDVVREGFSRIENTILSMKEIVGNTKNKVDKTNIYNTIILSLKVAYNRAKHVSNIYLNDELFNPKNEYKNEDYITLANASKIEQVWIVIINNALDELVKISDFEKRSFRINIKKDKKFITVTFEDNAGGIDSKILDKVFESFKSTKKSSGIGIGLSIAKKIILFHNGEIKAFNSQNGAVFEVKLPIILNID